MTAHTGMTIPARRCDAGRDISVIVPTCDRPQYLREALGSILAQTQAPLEILVVNNGESKVDGLPDMVTVLNLPPRVGPSRARNFGVSSARGRYVAFLDDDDWWDPDFLRNARAAICGDVRAVFGQKYISDGGRAIPYKLVAEHELNVGTLLRRNPGTGGMNLLMERDLFLELGGFDEKLLISEDRALALDILRSGNRIGVAADAIAIVRQHESERLRQRHLRKLRFVRKYVRLYTPVALLRTVSAIVLASANCQAKRFWSVMHRGAPRLWPDRSRSSSA